MSDMRAIASQLVMRGLLAGEDVEPWLDADEIGDGRCATVYPLGDRMIVKLTEDDTDATAAVHVKALQDRGGGRNLVRVHAVFRVGTSRYAIVNERVDPLPADAFNAVCSVSNGLDLLCQDHGSDDPGSNVVAICDDLLAAGILRFSDWHAKNVMWRHEGPDGAGRVVLVDFGCSVSPDVEIVA